jgi:ligand-binding sensor domain-containing protein
MKKEYIINKSAKLAGKLMLCLLLFCGKEGWAQESLLKSKYSYRRYTIHDGLPNHMLELTFQDKQGYLWIGTYKGFAKFDGKVFKPFLSESSINILHIENGENDEVRAYSYHDVFVIRKNDSVRTVNFAPAEIYLNTYNSRSLPQNYLILENEDATEKYLVCFQNDKTKEILRCKELNSIHNTKPYLDLPNNKIYLPSRDFLNVYDIKRKQNTKIALEQSENFLLHSRLGLLAFTNNGIYRIIGSACEKLISYNFSDDKIALEMDDGSINIKDKRNLYRFSNNAIEVIVKESTPIVDIRKDNEGNLWLSSRNGLFNYFKFDFKNYSLENDIFKTVLEDNKNNLWFGTIYGNLYLKSKNQIDKIQYAKNQEFSFMYGSTMIDNKLYFSRDNDVLKYENEKFSWLKLPYEPQDYDGYYSVVSFDNDKLLILRATGVFLCDVNGKVIKFYPLEFFKQQDLQNLIVIDQNKWAVGGSVGISVVENDSVILVGENQNMHHFTSLCADNQKRIWSATGNQLNLIQNDSILTVHRFVDEAIQGIYSVNDNYLIIATMQSIYFFNLIDYFDSRQVNFIKYNHNNGFTGLNVQVNSFYRDHTGILYLLCNDVMVTFDPQMLIRQTSKPNLIVQNFSISKDNVKWENVDDFANTKFSYKNRNIKFSVIGLNYSAVDNVRYHYRLPGFQNDWSKPSQNREITFNNLLPGDYLFEIYADAGTDESRSETQSFAFSIQPAFWQTAWFPVISILLLMLLSAGIALYFQRRKNKILLEKLETEKQLNELRIKTIRLKAIPHFNANVLAAIEYYIMNRSKDEAIRLLGIYARFTFQTLREVDKAARSLNEELEYVKMYLELEKLRFIDKFDYWIEVDETVDSQQAQLPNMILHTYCENAVKHGLASKTSGGLLVIKAIQSGPVICVSVEDNGVGRAASAGNRNVRSSKQGLDILSRQIEIYNRFNKTKIRQTVDDLQADGVASGTRFTVEVPVGFNYEL